MRRFLALFALLYAFLCAVSCSPTPPPAASEVLLAMETALTDSGQPLPDGTLRLTASPPDSPHHLTETLFSALYGEAARGLLTGETGQTPPIGDAALYLSLSLSSAAGTRELAVFRCSDLRTASTVAGLCQGRLDLLCRAAEGLAEAAATVNTVNTVNTENAVKGAVVTEGCYVILAVAEDPAPAIKAARRMIP